jgi:hypothetical protein
VRFPARHLRQPAIDVDHDAVHVDQDAFERRLGQHLEALARATQLVLLHAAQERQPQQPFQHFAQLARAVLRAEGEHAPALFDAQPGSFVVGHAIDAMLCEQREGLAQTALGVVVRQNLGELGDELM